MTTPVPAPGGPTRSRAVIGVAIALALLLLAGTVGFVLMRPAGQDTATPAPTATTTVSGSPTPAATVTVTATPSPSLPLTGGDPTPSPTGASSGGGSGDGTVDGGTARDFTMTASLGGSPVVIGQSRDLVVVVRNPNDRPLTLAGVRLTPTTPSKPGCLASWVSVGSYDASRDGPVRVPAGGEASFTVPFQLLDLTSTNQNACQGATFPVRLTGSGSLA